VFLSSFFSWTDFQIRILFLFTCCH